jgi:pectate lyase C
MTILRTRRYTHLLIASLTLTACAGESLDEASPDSAEQTADAADVLAQESVADRLRDAIEEARKAREAGRLPGLPAQTEPAAPAAPTDATPPEGAGAPAVEPTTPAPSLPASRVPAPSGPVVRGSGGVVESTIVVKRGTTFDGQNKRYTAGRALGNGSQDEGQKPVFKLEDGANLINVVLGAPAADGIHTYGNVVLRNIVWEDIGEDAMTIKESGTVVLDGGSARNGDDKVFQINAASTFRVSNFKAQNAGKFIRQNGDTTFKVQVYIDRCDISNMKEAIFRTDSSTSTVSMTNTRYSKIGKSNFVGVRAGNITQSGNAAY